MQQPRTTLSVACRRIA